MKGIVTMCAALAAYWAWGIGASQEWVRRYVESMIGGTNRVVTVDTPEGAISGKYEPYSVYALMATNSTHHTVGDGFIFAYAGNGIYRGCGESITATPSNFVWRVKTSVVVDGFDTFSGAFSVVGCKITKSEAEEVMK